MWVCVMFVLFLVNGQCDVPAAVSEKEMLLDPVYQQQKIKTKQKSKKK